METTKSSIKSFRDLNIWKDAITLVKVISKPNPKPESPILSPK